MCEGQHLPKLTSHYAVSHLQRLTSALLRVKLGVAATWFLSATAKTHTGREHSGFDSPSCCQFLVRALEVFKASSALRLVRRTLPEG